MSVESNGRYSDVYGARLAMVLTGVPGSGRVTVNRLLRTASTLADLRGFPREQLAHRLAGIPNGANTVEQLHDDSLIDDLLSRADLELDDNRKRRIAVLSPNDPKYPAMLGHLEDRLRPELLFVVGSVAVLNAVHLAVLGGSPIDPPNFEYAQKVVQRVGPAGVGVVTKLETGFDVAIAKTTIGHGGNVIAVLHAGVSQVNPELRPTARSIVDGGGAIVTPFPWSHGPFRHDRVPRSVLAVALSRAVLVADANPEHDEVEAGAWAKQAGRPVFSFNDDAIEGAHPVRDDVGIEWVLSALASKHTESDAS